MKKLFFFFGIFFIVLNTFAQAPDKMSYQAVIRENTNSLVVNTQIGMKISIIQGSPTGSTVFSELHSPTSNNNGLVSIEIGTGSFQNGNFSNIDWANGPYYIMTETDISGGTNYTLTGTSQLLTVPYAAYANKSGESEIEFDPLYSASPASNITDSTILFWNNKSEFDGNYSSLTNAPDIANTTDNKTIQLNTQDINSSISIDDSSGTSLFKVYGNGRITGDGSGLSNVKPLINYIGGNQELRINSNYGSYTNVRTVTFTVPASGVCFVIASGVARWESTGWDLLLASILMDENPNSSLTAENNFYYYLCLNTDFNCTDSSDQYSSFCQQRCFNVSAGTHTFTLWANKYSPSARVRVLDVNLSVMYFPTAGTGKTPEEIELETKQEEEIAIPVLNTVSGN